MTTRNEYRANVLIQIAHKIDMHAYDVLDADQCTMLRCSAKTLTYLADELRRSPSPAMAEGAAPRPNGSPSSLVTNPAPAPRKPAPAMAV